MNSTLHQLQREIADSLHNLDAAQTQLHPPSRPNKWSIQQIIEHLLLTYASTETAINARLTKRTPTRAKPTVAHRVFQFAVTRCGYFPTSQCASHTVLGPLNIDQWRKFQLVHGEHHLKQIAAIRKAHNV